jgi:DNA-binding transcriptional MerR regulator
MSVYSIKDLERYTGIKAHTLRIWEQRYELLSPNRSQTNIRKYNDSDLRHLLNVSFLYNHGIKISHLAKLAHSEIENKVNELSKSNFAAEAQVDNFVAAMLTFDEQKFESTFEHCTKKIGFNATMTDVIYPFLQRIGVMWQTGIVSPGEEHFIINLVRQKLISATELVSKQKASKSGKCLLYLPENEFHEMGLLYYNYLLRSTGYETIYLGQSVPFNDVIKTVKHLQPKYLITILTCPKAEFDAQQHLNNLGLNFKTCKILVSGYSGTLEKLKIPKNTFLFKNPEHFKLHLEK